MFNAHFLASYANGGDNWLRERLSENSLYSWSPRAPIRLYFGARDGDVSPSEARLETERMTARGCDISMVNLGDHDHQGSVLPAVPLVLAWFDELTKSQP